MHLPILGLIIRGMSELDICFVVHEMDVCIQVGPYRGFGGEALLPFRGCEALLGALSTAHKCDGSHSKCPAWVTGTWIRKRRW